MQLFLRAIVTSILHFLLQLGALLIEELVIQTSVATAYQVTPPKTNPTYINQIGQNLQFPWPLPSPPPSLLPYLCSYFVFLKWINVVLALDWYSNLSFSNHCHPFSASSCLLKWEWFPACRPKARPEHSSLKSTTSLQRLDQKKQYLPQIRLRKCQRLDQNIQHPSQVRCCGF